MGRAGEACVLYVWLTQWELLAGRNISMGTGVNAFTPILGNAASELFCVYVCVRAGSIDGVVSAAPFWEQSVENLYEALSCKFSFCSREVNCLYSPSCGVAHLYFVLVILIGMQVF